MAPVCHSSRRSPARRAAQRRRSRVVAAQGPAGSAVRGPAPAATRRPGRTRRAGRTRRSRPSGPASAAGSGAPGRASITAASSAAGTPASVNDASTNALPTCPAPRRAPPGRGMCTVSTTLIDPTARVPARSDPPRPARTCAAAARSATTARTTPRTRGRGRGRRRAPRATPAQAGQRGHVALVGDPDRCPAGLPAVLAPASRSGPPLRRRFSTVSGSSVVPLGPTSMSVPVDGQTPQSKHGVQRQSSCSRPSSASCQSSQSQSRSSPESRWSQGRISSRPRSRVVNQPATTPSGSSSAAAASRPARVGEVLAPAVETAALAPDPLDHRADPAVAAGEQSLDQEGSPSW